MSPNNDVSENNEASNVFLLDDEELASAHGGGGSLPWTSPFPMPPTKQRTRMIIDADVTPVQLNQWYLNSVDKEILSPVLRNQVNQEFNGMVT
jgi:hypothetical protein